MLTVLVGTMKRKGFLTLCLILGAVFILGDDERQRKSVLAPQPTSSIDPAPFPVESEPGKESMGSNVETLLALPSGRKKSAERLSPAFTSRFVFAAADRLNVRATPNPQGQRRGMLLRGARLTLHDVRAGWARVTDPKSGLTGWVSANFLSENAPRVVVAKERVATPKALVARTQDRAVIVQKIIRQSIASYSGRCPCPYHTDRAGRRCGGRSAYSRAGGARVICYAEDVTEAMVAAWR